MKKELISRKTKDYERLGITEELQITSKSKYIKYIESDYKRITKIYNNKNEFIGVDVINIDEFVKETIFKDSTGETIVILHSEDKKYKGVAKCLKYDYYDPQKGYEIAMYRARIKMYEDKLKELCK